MRWNRFLVCSACDEIRSAYAQCTCKTVHILPLAEHARKFVPRMLSVRWNRFLVCSACDKIVSAYAQHAHKIIFEKSLIKMQISTIKNQNLEKTSRNPPNRTIVKILKKKIFGYLNKNLVPRMLSYRVNVRASKFWRKSKETKRNFFRKFTKGI